MDSAAIISELPPYKGQYHLLTDKQDTDDIINEILDKHDRTKSDYDLICEKFWKGSNVNTAKFLFDFLKKNVNYKIEGTVKQTVKSPAAILSEGHGDCKHYASFINGVFDALKRKGYNVSTLYRFASYSKEKRPKHVFAVLLCGNKEYFIDPVLNYFNQRSPMYRYKQDYQPGKKESIGELYDISGIQSSNWIDDTYGGDQIGLSINLKALANQIKHPGQWVKTVANQVTHPLPYIKSTIEDVVKYAKKFIFAANRNAFLALMNINAFRIPTQVWERGGGNRNSAIWKKIESFWKIAGGNPDALYTHMSVGVAHWNKRHSKKIAGIYSFEDIPDMYDQGMPMQTIGEPITAASITALLVAAAPVVAAIVAILKQFGVNKDESWQSVDAANAPTTSFNDNAASNLRGDASQVSDSSNAASTVISPNVPAVFDNNIKTLNPDDAKQSTSDFTQSVKDFFEEYKKPLLWTGVAVAGIIVLPRLMDAISSKSTRRR